MSISIAVAALAMVLAVGLSMAAAQVPPGPVTSAVIAAPTVLVSGNPAPGVFVARAVERSLRWTLPGRSIAVAFPGPLQDLAYRSAAEIPVRVTVSEGNLAQTQDVPVIVHNVPGACPTAQLLFVSNRPETLRFSTGLFRGSLERGESVRLLYHHRNGLDGQRLFLTVQVANPSSQVARLWINDADSPPRADELLAGHVAATRWLRQYWTCTAQLVEVAPNSTSLLESLPLGTGQVGSGMLQAWLSQGERVVLDVQGRGEHDLDPAQESYQIDRSARHIRGTFAATVREITIDHQAGRAFLLTIGDRPPEDGASDRPAETNYGVILNVRGAVFNPVETVAKVPLRITGVGGAARATFLVNGTVVETPLLRPGSPFTLATIRLDAHERRPVFISTMPQAGSSYPLRLLLGP